VWTLDFTRSLQVSDSYLATAMHQYQASISIKSAQEFQHLVKALRRRHRSLDRQAAHVLPPLLQQRHEVVDGQHDVRDQLIFSHADVSDGNTHTQDLLQLELDGGLDFVDLAAEIFVMGDWGREFTSCE
jgi:hypothetical protein